MVDLQVATIIRPPPALLALRARKILAPPPRGGAEEGPMCRGRCGMEGFGTVVAIAAAAARGHLKENKLKISVCCCFTLTCLITQNFVDFFVLVLNLFVLFLSFVEILQKLSKITMFIEKNKKTVIFCKQRNRGCYIINCVILCFLFRK